MAKFKQTGIVVLLYIGVVATTIIAFTMLVNVTGTVDSIQSRRKITNFMFNSEQLDLDGNHVKSKKIILLIQEV